MIRSFKDKEAEKVFNGQFSKKLPPDIQRTALERQMRDYSPIHPGEILQEEFLVPMGINQERLARDIGVPASLISEIVRGESGISADTALRLARYFGMSVEFWTGIQTHYEIEKAKMLLADRLEKEVKVFESA